MPDEVPVYNAPAAASVSSSAQLYQFLARYQLTRDPGTEWDYSNIGYWLLSQALATRAGMDYESLLRTRVLVPLKMKRTAVVVSPELKRKLAMGHDAALQPAPPFSSVSLYGAMPAAGGLVSSVNDLLTFLSAAMENQKDSPLSQSMSAMLETRRPMDGGEQALGWVVQTEGENRLIMHDGFTRGYASCVAWDPKSHVGVVVLSNQLNGVSDIAFHLLRSSSPLQPPAVARHTEIAIDSKVIDRYVGRYEAPEVGIFDIVRDHNFLTIQLPADWGLPKFRLRPESEHDFFVAELPIRVTFQADASGQAKVLVYPPRGQHAITAHRKLEK